MKFLISLLGISAIACSSTSVDSGTIKSIRRSYSNQNMVLLRHEYFNNSYGKVMFKSYMAKYELVNSYFYTLVNKFDFMPGVQIGVSKQDGFYINGSLFADYSSTVINKEPVFSSQNHDYRKVSYTYDYVNAANETYHLNTFINFEVKKDIPVKAVSIEAKMVAYEDKWFNWEQELFPITHEPFILYL